MKVNTPQQGGKKGAKKNPRFPGGFLKLFERRIIVL